MIGKKLGHYKIVEKLGEGGMGQVYRAHDEHLERDVAVKVLPRDMFRNESARKRFRKEALALSRLNHPNIETVHDFDTQEGIDFLVMEYIPGQTLREMLAGGPLQEREILRLGMQLAEGLAAAHEQGIIHRDLKPGNVIITPDGRVKILDFGLAKLVHSEIQEATTDSILTGEQAAVGTLPYMSPEQLRGEVVDTRTDIYAAGAVLYEMATGERVHSGARGMALISVILTQSPVPPRVVSRNISPTLEKIILKALDKKRENRHQSAAELLGELQKAMSEVAQAMPTPAFLEREREAALAERPVFVAREDELTKLAGFLDQAVSGQGRIVFVTGEAGKGKTCLVAEFVRRAQEANADLIVANGNCNAHTGMGDPYLPFREVMALLTGDVEARWRAGAISSDYAKRLWNCIPISVQSLVQCGPELIDVFIAGAALLNRARNYLPDGSDWLCRLQEVVARKAAIPAGAAAAQQSVLFEQYARVLESMAERRPMVLVLDDLQWADPGSIGLLLHLLGRIHGSRLLIVGAYRPEEIAEGRGGERHPLSPLINECKARFGNIEVVVGAMGGREFVDAVIDTEPNRLGVGFREALYRQTAGHSLFTVELLRGMQEQGALVHDEAGCWVEGEALDWRTLPARVEAMIGERMERLPENLRKVMTLASVEGESFTAEAVAGVMQAGEREVVGQLSGMLDKQYHLVSAQHILRIGGRRLSRYRFRHILFQKYLYSRLDEVERSVLHEDLGNALEDLYGEEREEIAVQLAHHFQHAGIADKAIEYLQKAATKAVQLSANEEAVAHFRNALALLRTLPESPERLGLELSIQAPLAVALMNLKGYADREVGEAFSRSYELCKQVGETPLIAPALYGLWGFCFTRTDFDQATQLAEKILALAPKAEEPSLLLHIGHNAQAANLCLMGEFRMSVEHAEQAIAAYSHDRHGSSAYLLGQNLKSASMSWTSLDLWFLGYPDQGKKQILDALGFARGLEHPFTLSFALCYAVVFYQLYRDLQAANKTIEEELKLSTEFGFQLWLSAMLPFQGRILSEWGQPGVGISQIRCGIEAFQGTGAKVFLPQFYSLLTEAYLKAEKPEEGLAALKEGMAYLNIGQRFYEAELRRLEGELLLARGESDAIAAKRFQQAIEVSRRQEAKSWELRATLSLARLWQKRGRKEEARNALSEIYAWFTEGFDTPDLKDAKSLLEELT